MKGVLFLLAGAAMLLMAAGPAALGGLALRVGWNDAALLLLDDPAARGVALYRTERFAEADAALARAGRSQTFNRGLSLAATGAYPLSVAYFDAVLFANPADEQARANRDLVAAMYPPTTGDSTAPGRIIGQGGRPAPAEAIQNALANAAANSWRRPLDARGLAASDAWLETITDDPGEFLRLRIRAEYERRAGMGLIRPEEADPW
jgi:Ca-activated chloride channel homolog